MIILTAEQAALIRGESSPGHTINPRALKDGSYCLNEAVLSDPAHGKWWSILDGLTKREVTADEFPVVQSRRPR